VARAEFLVRHHLLMSHLSQRRDLDDSRSSRSSRAS
jgi:UTP:GlnB (protein PII) uridylyltransferase